MTAPVRRQIVIGIGNVSRGDDGAGRLVLKLLQAALPAGADIELIEHNGEGASLLSHLDGAGAAFIADACRSGAPPGTVRRFDAAAAPLPQSMSGFSTHGLGLAGAIELARALGQLPPRCVVYAIEGSSFEAGAPLSPAVMAASADAADRLRAEIMSEAAAGKGEPCTKSFLWRI
jgi:hydrogenase maturation protease